MILLAIIILSILLCMAFVLIYFIFSFSFDLGRSVIMVIGYPCRPPGFGIFIFLSSVIIVLFLLGLTLLSFRDPSELYCFRRTPSTCTGRTWHLLTQGDLSLLFLGVSTKP